MTRKPEACENCGEWIEYVTDEDGIWAECACDAGYITLGQPTRKGLNQ